MPIDPHLDPDSKDFAYYNDPLQTAETWVDFVTECTPGAESEYFNAVASYTGALERLVDNSEEQHQSLGEFRATLREFLQEQKSFIKFAYRHPVP